MPGCTRFKSVAPPSCCGGMGGGMGGGSGSGMDGGMGGGMGGACSCTVRTCLLRVPAYPNAASHCGHAWSLRCSCTVCTCVLRELALPVL